MSLSWEFRKKWLRIIVGSIVLIAALAAFIYFNFLKKPETCFDGKQNQNETGVDCGGSCLKICEAEASPLIKLWTRPFIVSPGIASVVAYIENPNETAGIKSIPYEIRIYDDRNILIADPVVGTTFVGPKSKFAIFESALPVGNIKPVSAFIRFGGVQEWTRTDPIWSTTLLSVTDIKSSDLTTFPKIEATVTNTSLREISSIPVMVVVYGADNNVMTASQTKIDMLRPGANEKIYFSWQLPFSGPVGRIEIIPRVNPFIQPGS